MSILDDIGDGLEDLGDAATSVIDGGVRLVEDVFGGPGNIVGVIATVGATLLVGPGYNIPVFIGTSLVTNALIRHREMNGSEYELARKVYGESLPDRDRIVLTNLSGLGGRQFVVPSRTTFGQYVVNLGDAYDAPLDFSNMSYPFPGQVLIHELAHVWQIHHCPFVPAFTCGVLVTQYRGSILGRDVYNQSTIRDGSYVGRDWSSYNFEEQATLVDSWYGKQNYALRTFDSVQDAVEQALRPYIENNVRPGNPDWRYKFRNPPEVVASLTASPWRVRYNDGTERKVTFAANGSASFERLAAKAPASPVSPVSPLRGAAVAAPSYASLLKGPPSPLAAMTVARPSGLDAALAPVSSASSISGGMAKSFTNSGRWYCVPGKVIVEWTFNSEQWPTPLAAVVNGTRKSPDGTFTAERFGASGGGGGSIVK